MAGALQISPHLGPARRRYQGGRADCAKHAPAMTYMETVLAIWVVVVVVGGAIALYRMRTDLYD